MTQTISALYDGYDAAASAVNALELAGVPNSDISILANNANDVYLADRPTNAAADAGTGAEIGAAVGGVGGLLAGLGILAIPGVGPVVAAGWLIATVAGMATGAAVGGATGGLVGSLTKAGVPESEANFYAEGVRRGGALVTVQAEDNRVALVRDIMVRYDPVDAVTRGAEYRSAGWNSFDERAPAYTPEEIAAERVRNVRHNARRETV
ncbi:MAG TPA: general stress protein [Stellaceae bacterium]|jgi:hypothetical protein|nr:general stress protein [Stellaceae bacterium]